jgi:hydroxyethylthiazole kinase-like uncharacterized protein yjeF
MNELLTPNQMAMADNLAIQNGIPGIELMQNAGDVLYDAFCSHFHDAQNILIVCGIGNNGGDGFVLAEQIVKSGIKVSIYIAGEVSQISGDARLAFDQIPSSVLQVENPQWDQYDLIVDGMFGAGLTRDITGPYANVIASINASGAAIMAIDLPSGINGETGQIAGCAVEADLTVTFFRKKPGHILFPGQEHCGKVVVGQIGILENVLENIAPSTFHNSPKLWEDMLPSPKKMGHKHNRGHTLAFSGSIEKSGAIRLAAKAALRMGSGLVTIAATSATLPAHAARSDVLMLTPLDTNLHLADLVGNPKMNIYCIGPGLPPDKDTRELVLAILDHGPTVVLDAGALSAFSNAQQVLHDTINMRVNNTVLTPHEAEFDRIFPSLITASSKIEKARLAARMVDATIILKGPDTIIAEPDGRVAISDNGSPWLATAGSGDVLTGAISGLLAQGMPAFEAACAAVWFHGQASQNVGAGLIASDLDQGLKTALFDYHRLAADL